MLLNDVLNCKECIALVIDDWISMKLLRRENLFQYHFGQHKSYMDWHGTETGPLCRKPMSKSLSYGIAPLLTCNYLNKKMFPSARLNALNFSTMTHPTNHTTGHDWQTNWCWKALRNWNECVKNYGNENFRTLIPSTHYDRSKTTGECGIFQLNG